VSGFTEAEVETLVRDVTDDEVAFYEQHGWVKLNRLIAPELAGELLVAVQERDRIRQAQESARVDASTAGEPTGELLAEGRLAVDTASLFHRFMFSERMCRNGQRLINRQRLSGTDVPLRYGDDCLIAKPSGARAVSYHQDSCEHGGDRAGEVRFWLALDEVTPEMGAMRFLSGVHREGPLGSQSQGDLIDLYPRLPELYEWSPPFHYQAGDATIHHGFMVHGSPANTTDRTRWGWVFNYVTSDTRYWNGEFASWGARREPLADERWPVIYPR
jgi:ectoine hydroxylase-related dioxygenase (phytanoyl-CoA dioxygenase family)